MIRAYLVLLFLLLSIIVWPVASTQSSGAGVGVFLHAITPVPGYRCYRGCSFTVEAVIHNGLEESVNVSVETRFEPFEIMWTNYSHVELEPDGNITYAWILRVPRNISYGNHTLGLNITYTVNSTIYSMYREAWIEIIPRNVSLLVADLTHNTTGYYLVVGNPITDPGQYIVENITVTITAYNVSVVPSKVFVKKLYANSSYMIPLTISFNESDIGALMVDITTRDDVHGQVYFNYTFIVVNDTAYLNLRVINDYGRPLPGAVVRIAGRTYSADSDGCVNLVLPVGIYNYTVKYHGHKVSEKIALYTGLNQYTIVVDLTPPTIIAVKQEGYGILVKAYDPGSNCSGISSIVFVQKGHVWRYVLYPQRNVSLLLQPSLGKGLVKIIVADDQNNTVCTLLNYVLPSGILISAKEVILVIATVTILLILLIIISREGI